MMSSGYAAANGPQQRATPPAGAAAANSARAAANATEEYNQSKPLPSFQKYIKLH